MKRAEMATRGILGAAVVLSGATLTLLASADGPPSAPDPVRSLVVEAYGWKFTPAIQCGEIKGFIAQILPELSWCDCAVTATRSFPRSRRGSSAP